MIFLKKTEFSVSEETGASKIKTILISVGAAYLISLLLLLVLAVLVTYTSLNEDISAAAVGIIGAVSALAAGIIAAKNAQSRGYLHGMIAAVIYRILLSVAGELIYTGADFGLKFFLSLALSAVFGAIGGIIGINIGK